MAKKEVSVVIKAKNAMRAGLSAAGASLKKFGSRAAAAGKAIGKGFLIAGAAVVAFGVKMVQAFSIQETAEKQAKAALVAHGDEVENNMKNIKAFASAIQDETGVADENTIARAASLRMLGVEASALEDATKATIALGKAGMAEQAAIKAVAMAHNGDFEALNRYIPALRTAGSETEKASILNEFLTRGYAAQKDELDTVAGRWTALKGRIGDAQEVIGGAIANNGQLAGLLDKAGEAVKRISKRFADFVKGGGISRMIESVKIFSSVVQASFAKFGAYAKFGVTNAFESVKWFGQAAAIVFKNMSAVLFNSTDNMGKKIGRFFSKLAAKMQGKELKLRPLKMTDLMAGVKDIPKMGTKAADELSKNLDKIAKEREAREKKISDEKIKRNDEALAVVVDAGTKEVKAEKTISLAKVDKLKAIKEEIKLIKKKIQLAKDNKLKAIAIKEEIKLIKKKAALNAATAKKTIDEILSENKTRKDAAKVWEKNVKKAEGLRGRQGRKAKLSKKDQEWLDAFEQIEGARKGLGAAKGQIDKAQQQLALVKKQTKNLKDVKTELVKLNKNLNNLLLRG